MVANPIFDSLSQAEREEDYDDDPDLRSSWNLKKEEVTLLCAKKRSFVKSFVSHHRNWRGWRKMRKLSLLLCFADARDAEIFSLLKPKDA